MVITLNAKEVDINTLSVKEQEELISKTPRLIFKIKNRSDALILYALKKSCCYKEEISLLAPDSLDIQMYLASHCKGKILRKIPNQKEEAQLSYISHCRADYSYFFNPNLSTKVKMAMLKDSLDNIKYIDLKELKSEEKEYFVKSVGLDKKPLTDEDKKKAVTKSAYAIWFIKDYNKALLDYASSIKSDIITRIKNPSDKLLIRAIKDDGRMLKYAKHQTEQMKTLAVEESYYSVQDINQPSLKLLLLALKKSKYKEWVFEYALNHVHTQKEKEEIEIELIKHSNWLAYRDIIKKYDKHPSKKVKLAAAKKSTKVLKEIEDLTKEDQLKIIKEKSWLIEYIKHPCKEAIELSVKKDGKNIKYIKKPSNELILLALKDDENNIRYIKDPTEKQQFEALKKDCDNFSYIKNPTKKVINYCVKKDPRNIKYVKKQSEKLQILAINNKTEKSWFFSYSNLKNPSEKVKLLWLKKISISDISRMKNPSKKLQMFVAKQRPIALYGVNNLVPEVAEYIFKKDDVNFQFFNDIDEEAQLIALKYHPEAFSYFHKRTKKVEEFAVKQDAKNILEIKKPSMKLLKLAIKKDYKLISEIKNQTAELQKFALKQNIKAFNYIYNFKGDAKDYFLKSFGLVNKDGSFIDLEKQKKLIAELPWAMEFIKNPPEELQLIAVKKQGSTLQYFKDTSDKVKLEAIKTNGWSIQYVTKPSDEMKELSIKRKPRAIKYIKNPSEKLQLLAVVQDGKAIAYIKNPTAKVQFISLKQSVLNAEYIENIDENVLERIINIDPSVVSFVNGNVSEMFKKLAKDKKEQERERKLKKDGLAIKKMYMSASEFTDKLKKIAIEQNPKAILFFDNPTKEFVAFAIERAGGDKDFIYNLTDKLYLETSKKIPWSVYFVPNRSPEVMKEALKDNPNIVTLMQNPSEKMLLDAIDRKPTLITDIYSDLYKKFPSLKFKAIKYNPKVMQYFIENLKPQERKRAIDLNASNILYMKNRDPDIIKYALSKNGDLLNKIYPLSSKNNLGFFQMLTSDDLWKNLVDKQHIPKDVLIAALKEKGLTSDFLDNPTKENQLKAVEKAPWVLRFIPNASEEIKTIAVEKEPFAILFCPNPSDKLKTIAIKQDLGVLSFISDVPKPLYGYIVKKYPRFIRNIAFPSKELQMIAVKEDPNNLEYISLPDDKVVKYAILKDNEVKKYLFEDDNSFFNKIRRFFLKIKSLFHLK